MQGQLGTGQEQSGTMQGQFGTVQVQLGRVPNCTQVKKVIFLKKTLSIIGLILTFYIIYFLQINFFSWFNISGIKPNLFIVLVLCIGLFIGKNPAMIIGLIMGIYLDFLTGKQIGISSVMYILIGFLGGYFDKNFSKDSKITILLMVAGSTIIYETCADIYTCMSNLIPLQIMSFIKVLLIEVIFNVLLTIIIYPLIRVTGDFFETVFKKTKILTRYF